MELALILFQERSASLLERFHISGRLCLDVAANERLRAARAERHPFIVRQEVFESVSSDELLDFERANLRES